MYWNKIKRSKHFDDYHKSTLDWNVVVRLIYTIKNKRLKGDKVEIEDAKFYILCVLRNKILYVINVKRK